MSRKIIVYSKKSGVNQLLFETDCLISDLNYQIFQEKFEEHKLFAYALVDGIEIKLFTDREDE